jgi:2-polyprenyl-3-methyl-5-hydroxy-6-metoxy-1,4-benzoquinol methylase
MDSTLNTELKHTEYYQHHREEILALVPDAVGTVLDVGCAAGNLGRGIRSKHPSAVLTGIELQEGITQPGIYAQVHIGDVETIVPALSKEGKTFDCIIFADVLEHLNDVWAVIRSASTMLTPGGVIIASVPNIRHISTLKMYLFAGNWEYEKEGIMDKTHLRFFTARSVRKVFEDSGVRVEAVQLKEYLPTQPVKRFIAGVLKRSSLFRDIFAFQLIVVGTRRP